MDLYSYWRTVAIPFVRAKINAQTERGASLVEYALLLGLIALVCIVALVFFGSSMSDRFNRTGSSVTVAGS